MAGPDGINLRDLRPDDGPEIARVLESCGDAFRPEEIAIGLDLVEETLDPTPDTDYIWCLAEREGRVIGFACFGPVPLTEGTFDLYWIAVEPEARGSGVAALIEEAVAEVARDQGGRWILAETSSTEAYRPAHAFYARQGYRLLERIADFYRDGDDRLTFGKRLDQG